MSTAQVRTLAACVLTGEATQDECDVSMMLIEDGRASIDCAGASIYAHALVAAAAICFPGAVSIRVTAPAPRALAVLSARAPAPPLPSRDDAAAARPATSDRRAPGETL